MPSEVIPPHIAALRAAAADLLVGTLSAEGRSAEVEYLKGILNTVPDLFEAVSGKPPSFMEHDTTVVFPPPRTSHGPLRPPKTTPLISRLARGAPWMERLTLEYKEGSSVRRHIVTLTKPATPSLLSENALRAHLILSATLNDLPHDLPSGTPSYLKYTCVADPHSPSNDSKVFLSALAHYSQGSLWNPNPGTPAVVEYHPSGRPSVEINFKNGAPRSPTPSNPTLLRYHPDGTQMSREWLSADGLPHRDPAEGPALEVYSRFGPPLSSHFFYEGLHIKAKDVTHRLSPPKKTPFPPRTSVSRTESFVYRYAHDVNAFTPDLAYTNHALPHFVSLLEHSQTPDIAKLSQLIKYLQNKGNPNAVWDNGETLASIITRTSSSDLLDIIFKHGAETRPALRTALVSSWERSQENLKFILKNLPNLKQAHPTELSSIVHFAAEFGNPNTISALAEELPADAFNLRDRNGRLPLETALHFGRIPMLRAFVDAGADPNAKNQHTGETILHACLESDYPTSLAAFSLLLSCGADPYISSPTRPYHTPALIAARKGPAWESEVLTLWRTWKTLVPNNFRGAPSPSCLTPTPPPTPLSPPPLPRINPQANKQPSSPKII